MNISQVIEDVLLREGGFVNNPADRGGPTRYGITERTARRYGYTGDMRELPIELAKWIYEEAYVRQPGFHRLAQLSESIAAELVDTGVNMSPIQAAEFLQRALNVLNREGRLYPDLVVDGRVGPRTEEALATYLFYRGREGELVLLRALNCLQGERYIRIAENDKSQEEFVFGWLRNRVVIWS